MLGCAVSIGGIMWIKTANGYANLEKATEFVRPYDGRSIWRACFEQDVSGDITEDEAKKAIDYIEKNRL
jgi:hypothetical protein